MAFVMLPWGKIPLPVSTGGVIKINSYRGEKISFPRRRKKNETSNSPYIGMQVPTFEIYMYIEFSDTM